MPVLTSQLNPRSDSFKASAAWMRGLVDDLNHQLARIAQGGGEAARAKHVARGKLLPRERVEGLLDPDTPFLELAPLAAHGLYDGAAPGAGGSFRRGYWRHGLARRDGFYLIVNAPGSPGFLAGIVKAGCSVSGHATCVAGRV